MNDKQLELVKRVQDIMARENTIGTLEEVLYQLSLENKKRRDLEWKLLDEEIRAIHKDRTIKKFQGESIE